LSSTPIYQKTAPGSHRRTHYRTRQYWASVVDEVIRRTSRGRKVDLEMSATSALVRRHAVPTFFLLSYALSWWAWPLYALGILPNPVASFGPFLAALVVLAITEGKAGIVGLFRRMIRWPGILSTFAIVLLVPGVGGAWEEPGWRGYAVPRLQHGRSALVASLILGVLIAGWHLPLIVVGQVSYPDIVLILAAVIVFNWVFNNAKGSVLIIMLMHAANNAVSGSFFSPMFTGADSIRESWLLALVWAVVAVVVIAVSGPANFSRKHRKQEESPPHAEPERVRPVV
jgi:membrane protease YdiL (CAAX protease family)